MSEIPLYHKSNLVYTVVFPRFLIFQQNNSAQTPVLIFFTSRHYYFFEKLKIVEKQICELNCSYGKVSHTLNVYAFSQQISLSTCAVQKDPWFRSTYLVIFLIGGTSPHEGLKPRLGGTNSIGFLYEDSKLFKVKKVKKKTYFGNKRYWSLIDMKV